MSSQLGNLKAALAAYSRATEQQAAGLQPIAQGCRQSSEQILALIGGTTQRKDAEVQAAVTQAREQINRAGEALRRAAKVAQDYGTSL